MLHRLMAIVALAAFPAQAIAADVSGSIMLVSDYRYRGISLSDNQPALQASLDVEHESGLYAGLWASTIKEPGRNLATEIDFEAGYEVELTDHLGLDFMAAYSAYPSDADANYIEGTAKLTLNRGIVEAAVGASLIPRQGATEDELGRRHPNRYFFGEVSVDLPGAPIKVTAETGYERGFFDEVEDGGKWDWSAGLEFDLKPVRAGVTYVGSNAPGNDDCLVASLSVDF